MQKRHKLIDRQIARLLSGVDTSLISAFLDAVADSYSDYDSDFILLERSMELSSKELFEANEKMRAQHTQMIMSAKLSELGRMAGGISHEINTPLSDIALNAGMIHEICSDPIPNLGELARLAQNIDSTAKRIAKIIAGLRDFSREGQMDPIIPTHLLTLVNDTLLLCGEKFKQHQIEIQVQIQDSIMIPCRSRQISQVFFNLLNNSYDAIVSETPQWVTIEATEGNGELILSITDSGKGISEEIARNLFLPFFTTKEIGTGTGLGLSSSMGIIRDHGGTLTIDSTCPNTRFIIRLPDGSQAR